MTEQTYPIGKIVIAALVVAVIVGAFSSSWTTIDAGERGILLPSRVSLHERPDRERDPRFSIGWLPGPRAPRASPLPQLRRDRSSAWGVR